MSFRLFVILWIGIPMEAYRFSSASYSYVDENETSADQAKYVGQLMKTILEKNRNRDKNVNPKGVTGITLWGLYDTISWRASCSPLLLTPESPIQKLLSMNLSTLQNQWADRK